jgi:hypothetical protein
MSSGGIRIIRHKHRVTSLTLLSDLHLGCGNVDETLLQRDLERAADSGDRILINGDVFDAIVASDKRYTPTVLHKRFRDRDDTLNAAIDHAAQLLSPYKHLLDALGHGNHEAKILRTAGTSLTGLLADRLTVPHLAGYAAFIRYPNLTVYMHHGVGGADVFAKHRHVDADLVTVGHLHQRKTDSRTRLALDARGRLVERHTRYVATGCYVRSWQESDGTDNYVVAASHSAAQLGGARILVTPAGLEVLQ